MIGKLKMVKWRFNYSMEELGALFKQGYCPDLEEFDGRYEVKMLGWLKFFPDNYKVVLACNGVNRLWGNKTWGHFEVRWWAMEDAGKCLWLNYSVPGNGIITRRIRDLIRQLSDEFYIGKFHYVLFGKPRFLGYFILRRVGYGRKSG